MRSVAASLRIVAGKRWRTKAGGPATGQLLDASQAQGAAGYDLSSSAEVR
jgi:hypothetical protein